MLSRKLRFGWLDVLVLAVVFGLIGYVLHRAQSHFHYNWDWRLIPGYFARYDAEQGRWVLNLLGQGFLATVRLALWGGLLAALIGGTMGVCRVATLGRIADVLQARGELDEALRIRREDELPVYERLRSARDLLICRAYIGMNYLARGAAGDRQKALELLNWALRDAQRLQLPEARQIAEIIRQVQSPPDSLSSPDRQASDGG